MLRRFVPLVILISVLLFGGCSATAPAVAGARWMETDLYCGLSRADGTIIPDSAFATFLKDVVTPEFPDGLTVLAAQGQFRGAAGRTIREPSRVIVILYPRKSTLLAHEALRRIAQRYCAQFRQESVMEVDQAARVTFITGG